MILHDKYNQPLTVGDSVIVPARIIRVLDTVDSVEIHVPGYNRSLFLDSHCVVRVTDGKIKDICKE